MQQIGLNNSTTTNPPKIGFWKQQFQTQGTSKQKIYDWLFGVILPIVCFVFDPAVFKGNFFGGSSIFPNYKPFAYLLSFVCVMAMAAWLIWGEKLKWLNGFLAGLFFLGGFISIVVGVVLFPFSLLGLIILIGVLGFTPLFTSLVYLRNAFRALHASKMFLIKSARIYALAFGAIFSASLAWTINNEIETSVQSMKAGSVEVVHVEARKLRFVAPLVNFDSLAIQYKSSKNQYSSEKWEEEKIRAIVEVYKKLTGEEIENSPAARWD